MKTLRIRELRSVKEVKNTKSGETSPLFVFFYSVTIFAILTTTLCPYGCSLR